ncbi:MAG: DNA polymerase Y family protein [Acetivibrionales bacterium]|jgi:DNA polymerase-4
MDKRVVFHIDVNSAYLSWEAVYRLQHGDNIDLRTIPSIVGGDEASRHGIVLAKSIPAKRYNIQTGESLHAVRQKCPNLVVVPPRYDLYMQCSSAMVKLLEEYSPKIQIFSIDECFLDFTGMERVLGDPVEAAYKIKDRVKKELGFTINIGISNNKLLAKMGGDLEKPDKVHTLFPEEVPQKLWPLPVSKLYMVGRATAPKLYKMGIYTIRDLAQADVELLKYKLKSYGQMIWNFANGIEESPVRTGGRVNIKGIGNSTTTAFDVEDRDTAHMVLLSLVETVTMRLRQAKFCAQLVSVSIKTNELFLYSHQRKLYTPTDCTMTIYETACELFDEAWKGQKIRHLGVRVSELCSNDFIQLSLFNKDWEKKKALDKILDSIRMKYGSRSVIRSCFLNSGLKPIAGGVVEEDYPMMSSIL